MFGEADVVVSDGFTGNIAMKAVEGCGKAVSTIMKKPAVTAAPDTSIVDLLKMVRQYDVSSIPILNERQELVGLITKSSLVTALSSQFLDLDAIDNTQEVTA